MMVSNEAQHSWGNKPLGELVQFLDNMRVPLKKSDRAKRRGQIPYYGANGQVDWIDEYLFDEPLVLLAEDGGFFGSKEHSIAYKIEGKSWVNNHAHVLRPKQEIDIDYLHWILSFYDVKPFLSGSTRFKLTKSDASRMPISYPLDIQEQKRIAETLNKADDLKRKRKEANHTANKLLQSVFLQMFGNPIENNKNWKLMKLSQVGTIARGKSKHRPRNAPELLGGKYPLIQTGDVANCGGYIREYNQTYSEVGLKQSKMWSKGTLCITIAANIASTGILTFDSCFPDSVVGFIPNEKVTTEYVQYWLSFLQKTLEINAPQVAQKNINLEILSHLDIPTPPIELQNKFSLTVTEVKQLQEKQKQATKQISNLFDSMMSKAFNGELVTEVA